MPKEEWGTKRVCPTTGKRFYDLGKDPVISPYSGKIVELEAGARSRASVTGKPEAPEEDALNLVSDTDDDAKAVGKGNAQIEDELLEDDDDSVSLEEIADVAADDDEN